MKLFTLYPLLLVLTLLLAACGNDKSSKPGGKLATLSQTEDPAPPSVLERVEQIKSDLYKGIPKTDVDRDFKVNSSRVAEVLSYGYSGYSYRYELLKDRLYTYDDRGVDNVDLGAIEDGILQLVVFISYDNNDTLAHYTMYYAGADGVYEIRDGGDAALIRAQK